MSLLDTDTHSAAREVTSLKSELHQVRLDLERRISDVEMHLSGWRLYAFWALCTGTMIVIPGTQIILR